MKKIHLFGFISLGLLLSNLLLVAFILFSRPGPPHENGGPRNIIIERLHFDALQIDKYNELIDGHRNGISAAEAKMFEIKTALYEQLRLGPGMPENDSLVNEIAKLQVQIERTHYRHFQDIRDLCREDQLGYFNALIKDIAQMFGGSKNRPRLH